jgi:hypothetical protein
LDGHLRDGFLEIGSNSQRRGSGWYVQNNTGDQPTLRSSSGALEDMCTREGGSGINYCLR